MKPLNAASPFGRKSANRAKFKGDFLYELDNGLDQGVGRNQRAVKTYNYRWRVCCHLLRFFAYATGYAV
jgi:hypothetical protein